MDEDTLNKLKQYLASRQQSESGTLFGMPIKIHDTPDIQEIQGMPKEIQDPVVQGQLNAAGTYTPAARSMTSDAANNQRAKDEEAMAGEIQQNLNTDPAEQKKQMLMQWLRKQAGL